MHNVTHTPLQQNCFTTWKILCALPHHPFPHSLATTDVLMSPEFCLSQNVIEWGSCHSWTACRLFRLASFTDKQASEFPPCLLVGWQLISFKHWIVFCHLDMWFTNWRAILVASSLGLLWKKVAIIFIHRFVLVEHPTYHHRTSWVVFQPLRMLKRILAHMGNRVGQGDASQVAA